MFVLHKRANKLQEFGLVWCVYFVALVPSSTYMMHQIAM
jgi:hypothetical protein